MTRELTQRELRNQSGDVMRALDGGESFIVTRNGTPVGELKPWRRRMFAGRDVVLGAFAAAPPVDAETLRTDLDESLDQDPTPRG